MPMDIGEKYLGISGWHAIGHFGHMSLQLKTLQLFDNI